MSDVHRIRLTGFWKPFDDGSGYSRSFGRPRTIDVEEMVEVVGHCTKAYRIFVNIEMIGEGTRDSAFRWPISMPLQARNLIQIETRGEVSDIALEIRRIQPADSRDVQEA